jgi:hypothetical protein
MAGFAFDPAMLFARAGWRRSGEAMGQQRPFAFVSIS